MHNRRIPPAVIPVAAFVAAGIVFAVTTRGPYISHRTLLSIACQQ
jgi:hypothetical protein